MIDYEGMAFESVPSMDQGDLSIDKAWPDAMLKLTEDQYADLSGFLDLWLQILQSAHQSKLNQWAEEEKDYRAQSDGPQTVPFEGACGDVIPAIAMAVDPIQARLSTGVFKNDPVYKFKALKKKAVDYTSSLEQFVEYYQRHVWRFRSVAAPRLFEFAKHGTMAFKVVYEREEYESMGYDLELKPTKIKSVKRKGPQFIGVPLNDLMFLPQYQHIQDSPIVAHRIRMTEGQLRIAEASGKITNVDKIIGQTIGIQLRDVLENEQAKSANHQEPTANNYLYELHEIWFEYCCTPGKPPEKFSVLFHWPTKTFLQCRYNWYFHQKKPFVVIPYTVSAASIYGIGIAEMVKPFQDQITDWHRLTMDNSYLGNITMFIARKGGGIENRPKIFAGRVFQVDDPKNDLIPFQMGDVRQSSLLERQNLFGLAEKRTGVSDYLTGRESPIVGSRATASATMALINEGTRRVEETMENVRAGFAEMLEMAFSIWIQYGLDGVDDVVFSDDSIGANVKSFFNSVDASNVNGMVAIDLAVSDAANNRIAQQQMQLAIIQVMMTYLQKVFELGQMAVTGGQQQPKLIELAEEVASSARSMFKDLLHTYNIPNSDEYLPDLEKFLQGLQNGTAQPADIQGLVGGPPGAPGVPGVPQGPGGVPQGMSAAVGAGNGIRPSGPPIPTGPGGGLS